MVNIPDLKLFKLNTKILSIKIHEVHEIRVGLEITCNNDNEVIVAQKKEDRLFASFTLRRPTLKSTHAILPEMSEVYGEVLSVIEKKIAQKTSFLSDFESFEHM